MFTRNGTVNVDQLTIQALFYFILMPIEQQLQVTKKIKRLTFTLYPYDGCLGRQVVSVLDSGADGPGFKSQPRCCRVTVLGKLFTSTVPLFTKQQNWQQPS